MIFLHYNSFYYTAMFSLNDIVSLIGLNNHWLTSDLSRRACVKGVLVRDGREDWCKVSEADLIWTLVIRYCCDRWLCSLLALLVLWRTWRRIRNEIPDLRGRQTDPAPELFTWLMSGIELDREGLICNRIQYDNNMIMICFILMCARKLIVRRK